MNKCIICNKSKQLVFLERLFDDRYGYPDLFDIFKCCNCDYMRLNKPIERTRVSELYEKYYLLSHSKAEDLKNLKSNNNLSFRNWLFGVDNVAHYYVDSDTKVLDIGSASGVSLVEMVNRGIDAYGVEPDISGKKIADELGLKVHRGDIYDKPFEQISFDAITASQVIEHVENPDEFLKEIRTRLKEEGSLILSFPNSNSVYRHIFGRKWINWHVPYHINFFNKKNFELLANKVGFRVKKIRTITPNLWTILQLRTLVKKTKPGVVSEIWNSSSINASSKKSTFAAKFLYLIFSFLFYGLIPINRAVDLLGFGDSILVVLKKDEITK